MSYGPQKTLQELPAGRALQRFERIGQQLEKSILRGQTRRVGIARIRHQEYRRSSSLLQRGTGMEVYILCVSVFHCTGAAIEKM